MLSYLFGQAQGTALTTEPLLLAVLLLFVAALLAGTAVWFYGRRVGERNELYSTQLKRLGSWLFWVSVTALLVAGSFHEGAIFRQRLWLFVMLLCIYAVVFYALYYRFTTYPELERAEEARRNRRGASAPAEDELVAPVRPAPARRLTTTRRKISR